MLPVAHIIDTFYGSFSGQIIADSYEAHDSGVQIKDYLFSGNDKCQAFAGCSASATSAAATVASTPSSAQKKKLVRRQEATADTETTTGIDVPIYCLTRCNIN